MSQTITFTVPWHEVYAKLVLEDVLLTGSGIGSFAIQPPPLNDQVLRVDNTSISRQLISQLQTPGRSWAGWFTAVYNELRRRFTGTNVTFEILAVDELDSLFQYRGTIGIPTTDPVTITLANLGGISRFGRQIRAGDYIIWLDGTPGVDARGLAYYSYEINKVLAFDSNSLNITLQRTPPGGDPLYDAWFGTHLAAHTNLNLTRLIDNQFTISLANDQPRKTLTFDLGRLDNACIPVVQATPDGGATFRVNLINQAGGFAPGMRTSNGASYTLGKIGDFQANDVADAPVFCPGPESIRFAFAWAQVIGSDCEIEVLYVDESGQFVGLIDSLILKPGQYKVSSTAQMPAHEIGTIWFPPDYNAGNAYPPQVLPWMDGCLDAHGNVVSPGLIDHTRKIEFRPGGRIEFIVKQGSGTTLVVTVFT